MEPLKQPKSLNRRPRLCFHALVSASGRGCHCVSVNRWAAEGGKENEGREGRKKKEKEQKYNHHPLSRSFAKATNTSITSGKTPG